MLDCEESDGTARPIDDAQHEDDVLDSVELTGDQIAMLQLKSIYDTSSSLKRSAPVYDYEPVSTSSSVYHLAGRQTRVPFCDSNTINVGTIGERDGPAVIYSNPPPTVDPRISSVEAESPVAHVYQQK